MPETDEEKVQNDHAFTVDILVLAVQHEQAARLRAEEEAERLRTQVAELLPFAEREARRRSLLHVHSNASHRESGEKMLARIDAGEFENKPLQK